MSKIRNLLNTFDLAIWEFLLKAFRNPLASKIFLFGLLFFYLQAWIFRLFLVVLDFIFKQRSQVYLDIYWYNFKLLVRDIFSSVLHTNLGDSVEKLLMYYYTPTAARAVIAKPYRTLVRYEYAWYWQGNPAMFLPDKMWNDLVEIFDRKFGWKYRQFKKKASVEFDNFINKPYSTMWRGFTCSMWWIFSKRKLFMGFDIRGKISRFFSSWWERLSIVFSIRSMYLYHGFDKKAILNGDIPSLKASPFTYNFKQEQVIYKDTEHHVRQDKEEEKELNSTFENILQEDIKEYFQPAISDLPSKEKYHKKLIYNLYGRNTKVSMKSFLKREKYKAS